MKRFLFIAALFLAQGAHASFNGYTYQRTITVNHANVPSDQSNFAVLIATNGVTFSTQTIGGKLVTGFDNAYYSDSNCQFQLDFDTETVNLTGSATAYTWVRVPLISSTTDTTIYNCYGNAAITSYIGHSTGTWDSSYKLVEHLANNAASSAVSDSTVNNSSATAVRNTSNMANDGNIDGDFSLNGTSDGWISTKSVLNITGSFTLSAWVNPTALSGGGTAEMIISNAKDGSAFASYELSLGSTIGGGNGQYTVTMSGAPFVNHRVGTGVNATLNSWTYVVGTWDGTTLSIYVNGSLKNSITTTGNPYSNTVPLSLAYDSTGNRFYFQGATDEIRISANSHTADWIATEYNNQSAPTTFSTFGPEVGPPAVTTAAPLFFGSEM